MKSYCLPLIVRFLGVALSVSSLVSCATKVPVPQSFWQEKKAKIAVAVSTGKGEGDCYKMGNQGLLDVAINAAMATGPERAVSKLKPTEFRKVKSEFASQLKKKGFQVVEVRDDLNFKNYPKLAGGAAGDAGKDYSSVLSSYGADYLIVLSLDAYGSIRSYYGFIPLGAPSGYSRVSGFMVKKAGPKPIWNLGSAMMVVEPVNGEWDQSPEFKNLIEASVRALEKSRGILVTDFFN